MAQEERGFGRVSRDVLYGRRPWLAAGLVFVAATVLGLIEASQVQYDRAVQGVPITWDHALIHGLPLWYSWALMLPVVIVATRWIARRDVGWAPTVGLHLALGAAIVLVQIALFSSTSTALHGRPELLAHLEPAFIKYIGLTFLSGLVTYGALVGGWYGLDLYRRYLERERTASRLEVQTAELKTLLAESQLRRLQAQLEPHFLFNSLHALSSLMMEGDTTRAVRMTSRLSELLRRAIHAADRPEHSFHEELALVEDYLAVQQLRYEDRLAVEWNVDEDARNAVVPALLLQPLVENAIVHGVEASAGTVTLTIAAERADDTVRVRVANTGSQLDPSAGHGVGLENTRQRLVTLFGPAATLDITDVPGGVEVRVQFPFRPARSAAATVEAG